MIKPTKTMIKAMKWLRLVNIRCLVVANGRFNLTPSADYFIDLG